MNTIQAQEIKRRGIAAVDALIAKGDVHVIRNNRPRYVIITEERYHELVAAENENKTCLAGARAPLEEGRTGRVRRFATADELLQALEVVG